MRLKTLLATIVLTVSSNLTVQAGTYNISKNLNTMAMMFQRTENKSVYNAVRFQVYATPQGKLLYYQDDNDTYINDFKGSCKYVKTNTGFKFHFDTNDDGITNYTITFLYSTLHTVNSTTVTQKATTPLINKKVTTSNTQIVTTTNVKSYTGSYKSFYATEAGDYTSSALKFKLDSKYNELVECRQDCITLKDYVMGSLISFYKTKDKNIISSSYRNILIGYKNGYYYYAMLLDLNEYSSKPGYKNILNQSKKFQTDFRDYMIKTCVIIK